MYEIRPGPVRLELTDAPARLPLRAPALVREERRARNRRRSVFASDLRCECAESTCRATFPVYAEAYRRARERFIVVPAHVGSDKIVAAADRFFVVQPLHVAAAPSLPQLRTGVGVGGEGAIGAFQDGPQAA